MNRLENGTIAVGAPGSDARKQSELEDILVGLIRQKYPESTSWNTTDLARAILEAGFKK